MAMHVHGSSGKLCYERAMADPQPQIRRARRTDFTAVMALLAIAGVPVPPPDRATLRRFRNLVNDLSGDFYLAFVGEDLVGAVHATYCRRLSMAPVARIETLIANSPANDIEMLLIHWIADRARRRGCVHLQVEATATGVSVAVLCLGDAGFTQVGTVWRWELPAPM